MFTIEPNTTPEQIKQGIGRSDREALRESMERREHLEKLATMHAGQEVYVQISGEEAYADIASREDKLGYTDRLVINVPAIIPDQVVTNLDPEAWDLLFQKTEMYHELGHVLYTDWPTFEDVLFGDGDGNFGVDTHLRAYFKDWWNTLEDAAIERLLVERFNIEDDLRVKNENLLRNHKPGKMTTLREAIGIALMEYKHPVGWIDELLDPGSAELEFIHSGDRDIFEDEVHPIIEKWAPKIVGEGKPVVRNRMVFGLFMQILPHLDDATAPGDETEQLSFGFPDDAEDRGDESEGMDADPGGSGDDDGIQAPEFEPSQRLDADIQRDYQDQLDQQKDAQNQQSKQESMEKWARVIDRDYDLDSDMKLQVPDDPPKRGSYDDATRDEAQRLSQPLARELMERLRREQRTQKQTHKKSGKVDSKRVHKTQRGQTNVFTRQSEPDEKDYSCMIVVDRSGSMDSGVDMMPDTEVAAGALAYALEDIGVDVGQLSLEKGNVLLEKDISEDVDEARKKMFRGYNSGGTPLSDALALARGRLEARGGHPFVIVLTDGQPDHRERYRDQLHQCDFPVLGIYVSSDGNFDEDHMNESAYFHQLEIRKFDEVVDGCRNLVKQVMF